MDFLITDENGRHSVIAAKSEESVHSEDFRHIRWFRESEGQENCIGIILYAGNAVRSFGHRRNAVPMACMWSDR